MIKSFFKRPPDFIVGGADNPYLLRWWILPRNRFFNIYLHKFLRDDDDRALHDHPWLSLGIVIKGRYIEHMEKVGAPIYSIRYTGDIIFRKATHRHRIELFRTGYRETLKTVPAWTIFITGPRIREWGFWCEGIRFIPWEKFTSPDDKGKTGKGCDQ